MERNSRKYGLLLIAFIMQASCLLAQKQKSVSNFFSADNKLIQYTGRIDFTHKKQPRYWQPGVYVKAKVFRLVLQCDCKR